jgi:chromosome segregation ATPase
VSDTPVGERPATGGRLRQYESDAERARAWRERHRGERAEVGEAVPLMLAEASLGVVVENLRGLTTGHQEAIADLVRRVEEAIDALSDPQAIADELDAMREESRRIASEAEAQVGAANRAQRAAASAAQEAERAAEDAENAARSAWERLEALELELAAARESESAAMAEVERVRSEADVMLGKQLADHERALADVRAEHAQAVAEMVRERETELAAVAADHEAMIGTVRSECDSAVRAALGRGEEAELERARAEGMAAQLRVDLDRVQVELVEARESLSRAVDAARADLVETLGGRHRAELDGLVARHEGRVAGMEGELRAAQVLAEAARERAELYRGELERLTRPNEGASAPAKRAGRTTARSRTSTAQGSDE